MNAIIQVQLDRVETAVNVLVESITSYNPSVSAAVDVLSADDDLSKGLDQLAVHQANHAYILQLRHTAESLDERITSSLTLLANIRKELLATSATNLPEEKRDVPYHELLDFAKRISKFTVPPTLRPPIRPPVTAGQAIENSTAVNGASEVPNEPSSTAAPPDQDQGPGIGVSSLNQNEVQWLDPLNQIPFVPWPSEEVIKRGALAQIQVMQDQGVDPASIAQKERKIEEMEDAKMDMSDGGRLSNGDLDGNRANEYIPDVPKERERVVQKPKIFDSLDLYDPDEEV